MSPVELGSDIGGSIRGPAHFNGIYALKPSWGVVPSRDHIPGPPGNLVEPDINCNGPLARSLADLELLLDVVAGPVPEDARAWHLDLTAGAPVDDLSSLRVATVFDQGADLLPIADGVTANLEGYATRLSDAGVRIDAVPLPVTLADGLRAWQELVLSIIGTGLPEEIFAAFAEMDAVPGDDPLTVSARALVSRFSSWARANGLRQYQRQAWAELFDGYDVVLAPVMPTAAFPHDIERGLIERVLDVDGIGVPHLVAVAWCATIGSVLLPVVTVPTGPTPSGLPVGMQVIGPFLSDRRLLRVTAAIDDAAGPGFHAPPR